MPPHRCGADAPEIYASVRPASPDSDEASGCLEQHKSAMSPPNKALQLTPNSRVQSTRILDLLGLRRREALAKGWPEIPDWVFPGETSNPIDVNNFERTWRRLRRRAQKEGVRPLKLHCTRHTWASMALASGKSVRWVAEQLGHSSPMLTLKTYTHAIREEEVDLSFADFEVRDGSERLYPAPSSSMDSGHENAPDLTGRGRLGFLEHETGLASGLRPRCASRAKLGREPATLSLGSSSFRRRAVSPRSAHPRYGGIGRWPPSSHHCSRVTPSASANRC